MILVLNNIASIVQQKISVDYDVQISGDEYLSIKKVTQNIQYNFRIRRQFNCHLSLTSIRLYSYFIESSIYNIILEPLKQDYDNDIYFSPNKFYQTNFDFNFQKIETEEQLETYLSEFVKCLEYYEKEVFPKLLDIKFLAEYVGSLPFERQSEIPVGGKFPVHLFKKLAMLKWGNQESRYLEYKKATLALIEKYKLKKPANYIPEMHLGFDELVHHLENEPNPFSIDEA